jgi:hypothetical protein
LDNSAAGRSLPAWAGTRRAAALCAREGCQPREMDVKKIQQVLTEQGVKL